MPVAMLGFAVLRLQRTGAAAEERRRVTADSHLRRSLRRSREVMSRFDALEASLRIRLWIVFRCTPRRLDARVMLPAVRSIAMAMYFFSNA